MRIERIHIKGLFGMFEHDIRLNKEERITVIHGMNGIGKTMIFRILNSLFKGNLNEVIDLPFEWLLVEFENSKAILIDKDDEKNLIYVITRTQETSYAFEALLDDSRILFSAMNKIAEADNLNIDVKSLNGLEQERFLNIYGESHLSKSELNALNNRHTKELKQSLEGIKVNFVQTQRLLTITNERLIYDGKISKDFIQKKIENSIDIYSNELSNLIKDELEAYLEHSDELERSLGKRLISKEVQAYNSIEQLRQDYKQVMERRKRLAAVGILLSDEEEEEIIIPEEADEVTLAILSVSVQDMKVKLDSFNDFYARLSLFSEIINKRRFSYKHMSMDDDDGFRFRNENGEEFLASDLSSGEQHELVLMYELLFKVPEDSLVLIDEPEISLHVAWQ
ncbi:MAG: putative ATP-binding protein involved in virulence, partial [Bacteroidia bacterium]